MYTIKLLNHISPTGLSRLSPEAFAVADTDRPDGILLRSADMHGAELPDSLLAVARAGAGVNNIPVDRCSERGVAVFNTPGANANAVRELTICALLLSARRVTEGIAWCAGLSGRGDEVPALVEKGKAAFAGPELFGKTLGVVGLGAIGVMVANAAYALGMEVYGYDPYLSVDAAWGLSRHIRRAPDLKTIFENSDYITLHVPLSDSTRDMLRAETFAQMKRGVRVVNLARGGLVSVPDLKAALLDGTVARYVTDFPEDVLLGVENVVCTPHLGASTPESEENCARMAADELSEFLENGNVRNSVNLPNAELERSGAARITLIHKNIPNMLSQISSALSGAGLNIENLLNRSKKDMAYTILDASAAPGEGIVKRLAAAEGILRVRVI